MITILDIAQDSHLSNLFGCDQNEFSSQQVEEEYSPAACLDRPDDAETQTGCFMVPTPKARADRNLAETVDMDVSRTIDNIVIQHVAGSSSLPSSFLNRMDFDNVFSLDNIWRQPQLPMYGRFESVQSVVHSGVNPHDEPVQGVSEFKRKRLLASAFAKTDDQLVDCAMRQLKEIVLFQPLDSRLGRALLDISGILVPESKISTSFIDAVAGKAPGTISKRVADYHRFARWAVDGGRCYPMNISETVVYDYAKHLQLSGASATSLQSFIKAIGFFEHHIGFARVDVAQILFGRVNGVSRTFSTDALPPKMRAAKPWHQFPQYRQRRVHCAADTSVSGLCHG